MAERTAPPELALSRRELRRYSRHLLIPEIGLGGQQRLAAARVLVIGAGGLGSPALQYLAAAGVGTIGVMDHDSVDETNLQRQVIYATSDTGRKKAQAAAERIQALNPHVSVQPIAAAFDVANAREIVRLYDVVLDCTDRFATRYLINDACALEGKPDVYASIFRFDGQVSVFSKGRGPCYRCLYPHAPPLGSVPTCAEGGVLGVLAGIVGAWQANQAIDLILGIGEPLIGRLMLINSFESRSREVRFERDAACALCSARATIRDVAADPEEEEAPQPDEIDAGELEQALNDAVLLDVREPHEAVLGIIGGAVHIPASELEARMYELDSARSYVVACRIGVRSRWAMQRLHEAGFRRLRHLHGGLLSYAVRDPEFAFF